MKIEELLASCVSKQASDLHLLPGKPPLMRLNGELVPVEGMPVLTPAMSAELINSVMTEAQQQEFEKELMLDMGIHYPDIGNFRVSVLHQLHGIAAVFRIIPSAIPSLSDLGFPPVFKRILQLTSGLVLVTGSTGSGKSTTLAMMLDQINQTRAAHIITIEDPIEYIHEVKRSAINQLQVGRDTKDFATALRASLRQDPDVIFLGEMRDLETIRLALIAAETGHLVLGTMHASSAPMAISRIIDIFPTEEKNRVRNMLSETIQAVICQSLIPKKSGGRVAALEIMLATPAIRHLIHKDMVQQMETTIQTSGDIGMCTMEQYLQKLAESQIISPQMAKTVAANRRISNQVT